jgi:hypothetical protein
MTRAAKQKHKLNQPQIAPDYEIACMKWPDRRSIIWNYIDPRIRRNEKKHLANKTNSNVASLNQV